MERIPDNNIIIFSMSVINGITQFETNTEATFYLFLGEQIGYAKLTPRYPVGSRGSCYKLKDGIKYQMHTNIISEIIPNKDNIPNELIYNNLTILFNSQTADRPW